MKLVQIRPGKSVKVSDSLLEKAARAFKTVALSTSQLDAMAAAERRHGVLIGKPTPLKPIRGSAEARIVRAARAGVEAMGSSSREARRGIHVRGRSDGKRKAAA
jgi:hypothetical protein